MWKPRWKYWIKSAIYLSWKRWTATQESKGSSFPIVKCSECGLPIQSNNLKRHVRNKHSPSQYKPSAACADKDLAIYMVLKYRSGLLHPIHVQKLLHGSADSKIFYENNFCMDFMRICGKSGLAYEMYEHFKIVDGLNIYIFSWACTIKWNRVANIRWE